MGRTLRLAIGVVGFCAVAVVIALRQAPVIEHSSQLSFLPQGYTVERVRLLGIEAYVETSLGPSDMATAACLLLAGVPLLWLARQLRADGDPAATLFATAGIGALYLAADDLLSVHETIGDNLGFLANLPVIDHPDDAIFGLYGLVVFAFIWRHRGLADGTRRVSWIGAVVCGGAAIALDLLRLDSLTALEVVLKVLTGMMLLVGTLAVVRVNVERAHARRLPE